MKCNMRLERETKGAVRYQEMDDRGKVKEINSGAILGKMYIRKTAFSEDYPTSIEVIITER